MDSMRDELRDAVNGAMTSENTWLSEKNVWHEINGPIAEVIDLVVGDAVQEIILELL